MFFHNIFTDVHNIFICKTRHSSFRSFSLIHPILRSRLHRIKEIRAGRMKLTRINPVQSNAVTAVLLPAAISLTQPV